MVTGAPHTRWDGHFALVFRPAEKRLAREYREDGWTIAKIAAALEMSTATVSRAVGGIPKPSQRVKAKRRAHQWAPVAAVSHQTAGGGVCWCLDPAHA